MTAKTIVSDLYRNERGATAVEYGLICALTVIAMLGALGGGVTGETTSLWKHVSNKTVTALNKFNS